MPESFPVCVVPLDAPELDERAGSKAEFWFERLGDDVSWLFKTARKQSCEDCAEVVCAELAFRLGLPCASYELATFNSTRGVISRNFVSPEASLLLGNEVLGRQVPGYPPVAAGSKGRMVLIPEYTIANVLRAIAEGKVGLTRGLEPLPAVTTGYELFVGYLMFDVLVSNSDRHHRNWGFVQEGDVMTLAPTFDHGSSLGRELLDERRVRLLADNQRGLKVYAERGTSRFAGDDNRPISMMQAFEVAARSRPDAARTWADRLGAVGDARDVLARLPQDRITDVGCEFAAQLLRHNRDRIAAAVVRL